MEQQLIVHAGAQRIPRAELAALPVPPATDTFKPIPHHEIIQALVETLGFRHIGVFSDEYAVTPDGMRLFGVLNLETSFDGCRFVIGIRNSNDKSMRLAMTVGYRVFVCDNLAFQGDFTPVLAKHSKNVSLIDTIALGVERMQRNFEPMQKHVLQWKGTQIADSYAKLVIYRAFVEAELDVPRHLARDVHHAYFQPTEADFQSRTLWSLENAFTATVKRLEPITYFKATAKLGAFFNSIQEVQS